MRILFLTASLEPGRDGVGDYTRLLAEECVRQSHEVCLIALHDPHIEDCLECGETFAHRDIPILRLPARLSWQERNARAQAFRAGHPADWVSLQFVAYAYDPKGFVRGLAPWLKEIIGTTPLQIMFHELWIGTGPRSSLRHWFVGRLQRLQLRGMIRDLAPWVVTVTNPFYRSLLGQVGSHALELPLFGNIPLSPALEPCEENFSQGLFFGTLHQEWEPEPFMPRWITACAATGKRPRLVALGRIGAAGEAVWARLQGDYADKVDFVTVGEVSSGVISSWLQRADFGLAASPWHLMGKSGSAAAMLDHGLPVVVTRDEFPRAAADDSHDALLHRCDDRLESKLMAGLPKQAPRSRLPEIARDFVRLLQT